MVEFWLRCLGGSQLFRDALTTLENKRVICSSRTWIGFFPRHPLMLATKADLCILNRQHCDPQAASMWVTSTLMLFSNICTGRTHRWEQLEKRWLYDAFEAVILDVATRGQSLTDNAGINAPLSIIVIALFKCSYVIFFAFVIVSRDRYSGKQALNIFL